MNQNSIESFLLHNAGCFDEYDLPRIAEGLKRVPDEANVHLLGSEFKKPSVTMILSIVGGMLGADRFYLGQTALGVIKLITCGGFGIWTIIDIFISSGEARSCNAEKIVQLINQYSVKTQRPATEVKPTNVPKIEENASSADSFTSDAHKAESSVPGTENPMNYAPKDDYSQYAPKPQDDPYKGY